MNLKPKEHISKEELKSGLSYVVKEGLTTEAMATLTGGAFLVSLALFFNASNFQIGLLAALPTLANIFQLFAIYLVHKYANRRKITVATAFLGRVPLLLIAFLPFLFPAAVSLNLLIALLVVHYVMGAISGSSWTSWMKDLIPQRKLGSFFANRSRLIQIVGVTLSLLLAFGLDYVKLNHAVYEINAYSVMFFTGGVVGLLGLLLLSRTPEPKTHPVKENLFRLFKNPLKNENFRKLIVFQSFWTFAINLAAPFFSVYMMRTLGLPLSYIVGLTLLSQLSSIVFIRIWGRYSDRYSNKTILRTCAPIYIACIFAWTFTTMPAPTLLTLPLLVLIHLFSGLSTAGINLAISNIGIKLAPKGEAMVFLSVRSMLNAFFAGIAPLIGGLFADYFAARELSFNLEWKSPDGNFIFHTLDLQQWDFFFVLAVILGLGALNLLGRVKEEGEVKEKVAFSELRSELRREFDSSMPLSGLRFMVNLPLSLFTKVVRKVRTRRRRRSADGAPPLHNPIRV
jgi:MFS family permease